LSSPITARKSITGAMWLTLQPFVLSAVGLPATVYVIRSLGPEGYGQWSTATALVGTFAVITTFGFRPLFTRMVAQRPDLARAETQYQLGLRTLLSLVTIGGAVVACLALHYPTVVLLCTLIAGAGATVSSAAGVLEDLLQGFQQLRQMALATFVAGLVLTGLSAGAAFLGGGSAAIALAYSSGPVVSLALLLWIVQKRHFRLSVAVDFRRFMALVRDSRVLGTSFVIASVRDRAESLLVPKLMGVTTFGYFAAGLLLADRLAVIPSNLTTAFFPLIAHKHRVSPDAATVEIRRLLVLGQVVSVPLCVLATFHADWIAAILFRSNADLAGTVISVTIWSLPLQALALAFSGTLQATGAHDEAGRANLITSLISLPASVVLVASFGVLGASISWVTRSGIAGAASLRPFVRRFRAVFDGFPVISLLLAASGMVLVEACAGRWVFSGFLRALAGGGVGSIVYVILLLLLRVVRLSDLRRFRAEELGSIEGPGPAVRQGPTSRTSM
jgi:O-antigen/teichoic acid export membrane protein